MSAVVIQETGDSALDSEHTFFLDIVQYKGSGVRLTRVVHWFACLYRSQLATTKS
jgi:hypothetical protein